MGLLLAASQLAGGKRVESVGEVGPRLIEPPNQLDLLVSQHLALIDAGPRQLARAPDPTQPVGARRRDVGAVSELADDRGFLGRGISEEARDFRRLSVVPRGDSHFHARARPELGSLHRASADVHAERLKCLSLSAALRLRFGDGHRHHLLFGGGSRGRRGRSRSRLNGVTLLVHDRGGRGRGRRGLGRGGLGGHRIHHDPTIQQAYGAYVRINSFYHFEAVILALPGTPPGGWGIEKIGRFPGGCPPGYPLLLDPIADRRP